MPPKKRHRPQTSQRTQPTSSSAGPTSSQRASSLQQPNIDPNDINVIASAAWLCLHNVARTEAEDTEALRRSQERAAAEQAVIDQAKEEQREREAALCSQKTTKRAKLSKVRNWFLGITSLLLVGVTAVAMVSRHITRHNHDFRNSFVGKLFGLSADQMMKKVDLKNKGILYKHGDLAALVEPIKDVDCFEAGRTKAAHGEDFPGKRSSYPEWKESFPVGTVVSYWGNNYDDQKDGRIRVRIQKPYPITTSEDTGYSEMCSFFVKPNVLVDVTEFKEGANKELRAVVYPATAKRPGGSSGKTTANGKRRMVDPDQPGFKG